MCLRLSLPLSLSLAVFHNRGFCFFNSVAIAAKQLQHKLNISKILIVDWVRTITGWNKETSMRRSINRPLEQWAAQKSPLFIILYI